MNVIATLACLVASALAGVRWLRVAQREHYLAGSCSRFALRWWWGLGFNRILLAGVVVNLVLAVVSPLFAAVGAVAIAAGPFGLRLRGTAPGPVRWTQRLRTVAIAWAVIELAIFAIGTLAGRAHVAAYLVAVLTPAFVDAALAVTEPLQRRRARPWIDKAKARLRSVNPTVVAITGSYGKTTTKGYVRHLVEGSREVVATPASFNNELGLARAVNEALTPGAEVFVAEMGTYGPGEIAAMCEWVTPTVAAITAIGPVHLERMGSEDAIAEAKAEILAKATTAVLNVDDARLAALADRVAAEGKAVVRCSAADAAGAAGAAGADVVVRYEHDDLVVTRDGNELARFPAGDEAPANVAIAVAIARALGVPDDAIAKRLPTLPAAPNRRTITQGSTGATFIDDTYNSNPAGARAALTMLQRLGRDAGRIVLVTPGMVELGRRQHEENKAFAALASEVATDIVIIGATNRAALQEGAHEGRARVVLVDDRAQATAWVRESTSAGDVVLFENDLPDHFP